MWFIRGRELLLCSHHKPNQNPDQVSLRCVQSQWDKRDAPDRFLTDSELSGGLSHMISKNPPIDRSNDNDITAAAFGVKTSASTPRCHWLIRGLTDRPQCVSNTEQSLRARKTLLKAGNELLSHSSPVEWLQPLLH